MKGVLRVGRPAAVAITGGIAAGKSEALRAFARHGAEVLSSDEIVHQLLREDREAKEAVVERFGPGVLGEEGEIDRSRLGELVFGDPSELCWLEALLHPRVFAYYQRWRSELAGRLDAPPVCAAEVPLLYEAEADGYFDAVVLITAPAEVRAARRAVPMGDREQRLLPDEEKALRADFVYVNDGSLEELDEFVSGVMARLTA